MGTSRGPGGDTWPSPCYGQSTLSHPRSSGALPKATSPARNHRKVGLDKVCLLMEGISGAAGSGFEPGLTDPESDVIIHDYVSMSSTGNPNAGAFSLPAYTVVWPKGWITFRCQW